MNASVLHNCAAASLLALIVVCVSWETLLAPLLTGGSWLALKCVPLLAGCGGVLRGKRYTYQWSQMLMAPNFIEGGGRGGSEQGLSAALACAEALLAASFFVWSIPYPPGH